MQPGLSVIVHGPDPQGHLGELLDALAADPFTGAEVVVAAVGDWARRQAERRAAEDPRMVVLPLPEGTGDGAARAAGAARATGRWLHFVHAKDGLPVGTLRTIADRTAELGDSADVLVVNHLRSTWQSTGAPSGDGRILARAGRSTVALADFPQLLRLNPVLGNRVVRADFWRAHQALLDASQDSTGTAGEALCDDETYTAFAVLLYADAIACLDHVAYEIRELREQSLPSVTVEQRYALIGRYERLHRLLAERGAPEGPRTVLYDVMVRELLRTFVRSEMPETAAREFFTRASRAAVHWRPENHRRPAGFEGIRRSLLEDNAYTKYRAFQTANQKRREVKSVLVAGKRQVGAKLRDRLYRRALSEPVDPHLAVFSAYWDRGVACNPAAIATKLAELAPHIRPVWVVSRRNAALLPPGTNHIVPGTRRYWDVMARAKYLVNNVNFPNAVVKRPDAIHLQTHHGTPLKRMGLDQLEFPAASKGLDFDALLARIDKWDYSVSANSHSTRMWERAYPSRYTPLDYGYPRNDVFYSATAEDIRAIRDRLGIAPGRRAILYAPTHRDYEVGWTPRLDLASLADRLGEDTVLLVRGHYFYGGAASPLSSLRRSGRVIDVSSYDPVEELSLAADALVTDYSSIMFDYANLNRPIVIYADDWETYAKTRGVYFDLMAEAPGQVAHTQEELAALFETDAWRDEAAMKALAGFRRRFCEFDDGRAAERVVRRVFLGESEESLPPVVPVDERTPAPTPEEATAWQAPQPAPTSDSSGP
ncbi:CDP-glycerol glycerophosphotransferase family protein [Streptomyces colonosanans]|uniref:CDP-glycerol--poly(Glycerophosphate) glycerophosphotransferase n=1 Tax=Streptomyces colonosanans TaxID=1428652 RepID=A0A1S2NZS3_9ACTN|nr:CDP-glycerol glycerophosphotransferase family protein [Streptomyces colonosanans]OIJ86979.1 CDP-glycerol--poly(glycerophosphate) glycerophosphotransferase [Streptomyces colonosanans]